MKKPQSDLEYLTPGSIFSNPNVSITVQNIETLQNANFIATITLKYTKNGSCVEAENKLEILICFSHP